LPSGAGVAVQATENAAIQETDPTTALATASISTVAGQVDSSRQLWDFARPGYDQAPSADLGSALGAAVDVELVAGTNTAGRTMGLANVSGTIAVAYTDASPTAAEFVSKLWEGYHEIVLNGGGPAEPGPDNYVIAMHPRRLGFISAAAGNTAGLAGLPPLPGRVVASAGIRTNLGGGTEDEAYVIARDEVFVSADAPRFAVREEVGSGTLTVRFHAFPVPRHDVWAQAEGNRPDQRDGHGGSNAVRPERPAPSTSAGAARSGAGSPGTQERRPGRCTKP
jgi:hypothetical protein